MPSPTAVSEGQIVPGVWVLTGHKTGDNAQSLALAKALGWPYEVKSFVYAALELIPNLTMGATLGGIVKRRSSRLQPPWPDLVITAGRRNEPIARWIRSAAAGAGQRVRVVHLGRPWNRLDLFDLIVTTPQYRLPERPNILHNETPLHGITRRKLNEAAAAWAPRFAHLPQPLVTVLVGGAVAPYEFGPATARRLAAQASALAAGIGGSLLISTSARTPDASVDALCAALTVPSHVYRWSKDAVDNPFVAMLALAEQIVVTGDSMSMLTEACATGKPVHIFDLGEGDHSMRAKAAGARPATGGGRWWMVRPLRLYLHGVVKSLTPPQLSRDIAAIHRFFVGSRRAVWLGDPYPVGDAAPHLDPVARTVERIRLLFAPAPAPVSTAEDARKICPSAAGTVR